MTNREWLNTLTNEEFAEWSVGSPVPMEFEKVNDSWKVKSITDKLYPRLSEIKVSYASSKAGLLEWLEKEHFDWSKAEIDEIK